MIRKTLPIVALALAISVPAHARDNILVMIAGDLGVDMVGVYSRDDLYGHDGEGASPGPTPTIDGLAADGVLFATPTPTHSARRHGRGR